MRLREGAAAMGVWLPLALADVLCWLACAATMGETRLSRADALRAWHLPELAAAVARDEAERAADDLAAGVDWLADEFGKRED